MPCWTFCLSAAQRAIKWHMPMSSTPGMTATVWSRTFTVNQPIFLSCNIILMKTRSLLWIIGHALQGNCEKSFAASLEKRGRTKLQIIVFYFIYSQQFTPLFTPISPNSLCIKACVPVDLGREWTWTWKCVIQVIFHFIPPLSPGSHPHEVTPTVQY